MSKNNDKKLTNNSKIRTNSTNHQNIKKDEPMPDSSQNSNTFGNMTLSSQSDSRQVTQKVECLGQIPTARFGHTMVLVSPVKAVLFGGAVGDTKTFTFSNETYILNLMTKIWLKAQNQSQNVPAARAAHAACTNDAGQMIIYGGSTGGGSLASDELHILDLGHGDDDTNWTTLPTTGKTPGKRYGHTLCYIKPNVIVFGGNTGSQPLNDVWVIQMDRTPFSWVKIELSNSENIPSPRVYHACGVCMKGSASGMMIIYGGRDASEQALNDTWGLRKHRDGRWDWLLAPYKPQEIVPKPRFNHFLYFLGQFMIVTGGRTKNIQEFLPTEVYDTETSEWKRFSAIGLLRHIAFHKDTFLYIYGGFENSNPNNPIEKLIKIDLTQYFKSNSVLSAKIESLLENKKDGKGINSQGSLSSQIDGNSKGNKSIILENNTKEEKKFILSNTAVVLKTNENYYDDTNIIRKVAIEKLSEEAKKIGPNIAKNLIQSKRIYNEQVINKFLEVLMRPFEWYIPEMKEVHDNLPFSIDEINSLINEATKIITKDQTLVKIKSPAKIFGSLYGQYNDLMRFFESFGHPSDDNAMGDIHKFQYVFLGNYVDRGIHSLETIFLLLSLKVKYSDHIILLRGHHEDSNQNILHGLADECENRIGENIREENSIYMRLNNLFEILPLAALIDNKILCVSGGIGSSVNKLSDIASIRRPVQVVQEVMTAENQILLDLLWSEYTEQTNEIIINDERENKNGFIVKFGKDRLLRFLIENNLQLLVNSHSWVAEGVKKQANDKLITLYSASNYADRAGNLGGILIINKYCGSIDPKLIDVTKTDKKAYKYVKNLSPIRK